MHASSRSTGALVIALAALAAGMPASWAVAGVTPGHRLPVSQDRPVRVRQVDIEQVRADLQFDMEREQIKGTVRIRFAPLQAGVRSLELDAFGLAIESVKRVSNAVALQWHVAGPKLLIDLPSALAPGQTSEVLIAYSARPRSGLYFQPASNRKAAQAWNFGEGGLHYGWLPLYNDTNDRFAVEFRVTVPATLVALSNGVLKETTTNRDGTRTFRWVQDQPIANYLIALKVGDFKQVKLASARVGSRSVPLSVWTAPGSERKVAENFGNTPSMVEYFSKLLDYPYPWAKYDQVTLREFGGAMETTTMVGFPDIYERGHGDPVDSSPAFDRPWPIWQTQDTISHELAHQWFGDLVTCRSLGSLWLNESFATYLHTVWNGHSKGEDDLTYQRWRYLHVYLDDVRQSGEVMPLERLYYDAPEDMYRESLTYLKGSLVIHMLRRIVGDEDFYRALNRYLKTNAFGEVEARDLQAAFERTTGLDLSGFFNDWIVGGGGHPAIEAKTRWAPDRRQLDLTLTQVQSDQPFENRFRLPVDVTLFSESGSKTHTVWLEDWQTRVALPSDTAPVAVSVDSGNWLVADIHVAHSLSELTYLLKHGDVAVGLRAARQLATDYPRRDQALAALLEVMADTQRHWGLRQEVALSLGSIGQSAAIDGLVKASTDSDRKIRRAVAVALGRTNGPQSALTLRAMIENDTAEDVIAAAAVSLGRSHAKDAHSFLVQQLQRDSQWWNAIRIGALQGLAELEDATLVPTFQEYLAPRFQSHLRLAALDGWFAAAPDDPKLAIELRRLASDRNGGVRSAALEKLGRLHRREDLAFLKEYVAAQANPSLANTARNAIDEIEAFLRDSS
jgi:aminopeptidase N